MEAVKLFAIISALGQVILDPFRDKEDRGFDVKQPKPKPPMKPNFKERIVMNALSQDWVRESSKNQGDGIAKYWEATNYKDGYKNREPYCAAFVAWCVAMAAHECGIEETHGFKFPKTARAFGIEEWSLLQDDSTKTKKKPQGDIERGDLVVFSFSHVGIATGRPDKSGHFPTIEGNTGAGGGNDGDGVYRKFRHIGLVRSRVRFTIQ